ncbi:S8 family peptidase [Marivita hallyeonensis]|uniref:S8 family peptidase n=1 Tax=Marivita hallyeonensis TaxID=996342 RepID=UPI001FE4D95D|nr:S8/S53 family peptidase [Marivita hallyeonensis]
MGVIDSPARRCPSLQHVEMYDIEGRPINEDTLGTNSHGLRVSAIIGERGQTEERRGIAPLANVTLIDVTDDDVKDEWDYSKIAPAIQILVDEFDVDIINISGGCTVFPDDPRFEDASLFFAEALDYAAARGVIVVAATGNDPSAPVALPARLDDAVGVGAIGLASLAPTKTRTKAYEAWALDSAGCTGTLNQHTLYHFKDTSFGDGLDMVGPGIGVVMTFEDGSFVEYDGTSYAAPYVTAVAACGLSLTKFEPDLRGRPKRDMRKSHIELLCVDLGMSLDRQGLGIPVLMSNVGGKAC